MIVEEGTRSPQGGDECAAGSQYTCASLGTSMRHHVSTNSTTVRRYVKEKYDDKAQKLAAKDPLYAAHNADSYGYYIEEMS